MRLKVVCLALLSFMLAHSPARAELSFYADQIENGLGVVLVAGEFDPHQSLDPFVELLISREVHVVVFDSPGGNPLKAMELGRIIRLFNLNTLQPRTFDCASACALAFMGGVKRIADPGAIGVHQNSFIGGVYPGTNEAVATVQELTGLMLSYMREMGVAAELLEVAYSYESNDMRYLSQSEMLHFGLVTAPASAPAVAMEPQRHARPPSAAPQVDGSLPSATGGPYIAAGQAMLTGQVRHPQGFAPMKAQPDGASPTLLELNNRTALRITGEQERWYEVEAAGRRGFMHHTWVRVEEYALGEFEDRHIQIKSFETQEDAVAFARSYYAKTSVFLATNGWYAVTLRGVLPLEKAEALVRRLKAERRIPADSFVTYGNTYTAQVCCQ